MDRIARWVAWSAVAYFVVLAAGLHLWGPDAGPMPIVMAPIALLALMGESFSGLGRFVLGLLILVGLFALLFGLCRLLGIVLFGSR